MNAADPCPLGANLARTRSHLGSGPTSIARPPYTINSNILQDSPLSFPLQGTNGMAATTLNPNIIELPNRSFTNTQCEAGNFPLLGATMAGASCQLGSGLTSIDSYSSLLCNPPLVRDTGVLLKAPW